MRARAAASHGCPELPLQPSVVWPVTRATFPAPAAMRIGVPSTMSGVGRGAPTAAFVDSCTSRYWPGASEPLSSVSMAALAPKFPAPAALAYWSDIPSSETVPEPRLKISM